MSTKQLYEKTSEGLKEFNPLVNLKDIQDSLSDTDLGTILNLYNHIKVDWKTDAAQTRRQVPIILRRSGMFITYHNGTKFVTEFYTGSNDTVQTSAWEQDSNWTKVPDADYISAGVKPGVGTIGYEQLNDNLKQLFRDKVNVTNYPDDEDICSQDNLLKLKDREADASNFQSKGYVILRKNLVTVNGIVKNILTQSMINKANTIYEIRYDFDLNGTTINIPENCTLKFEGGSLENGTLNANNTQLSNNININISCDITGTITNSVFDITEFGAKSNDDSVDNSIVFNRLIKLNSDSRIPNVIYIPKGKFYIKNSINLVAYNKIIIRGEGRNISTIIAATSLDYMIGTNDDTIYINTNFYSFGINGNRINNNSDETDIAIIFTYKSLAKCGFRLNSFKYCVMNDIYICDIDGSGIELSKSWCSRFENLYLKNNYYGIKSVGSSILNSLYFSNSEYYQHLYNCINITTTTFVHINQSTFERCGGPAICASGNIIISKCGFENLSINPITELDNVKYKTCISTCNGSTFSNIVIEKCSFDLHYKNNDDCKKLIFFAYNVNSVDINNNIFFTTKDVNNTLLVLGTTQKNLNRCNYVTLHQNYFRQSWNFYEINNNYDFIDKTISNTYFATIQEVILDDKSKNNLDFNKNIINCYETDVYKLGFKELNQTYLGRKVYGNDNSVVPNTDRNYITFINPINIDDYIGKLALMFFYVYDNNTWSKVTKNIYISSRITFLILDYTVFTLPEVYLLGADNFNDINYEWKCYNNEASYYPNKRPLLNDSIINIIDDKTKYIKFVGNTPILYKNNIPYVAHDNLSLSKNDDGFTIYDTTLKKMILWNGTSWVNLDGTQLS